MSRTRARPRGRSRRRRPTGRTTGSGWSARRRPTIYGESEQFSIGTGTISITSTPTGAKVYLDGIDQRKTTDCTLTEVAAGAHTVKLTKAGYLDYTQNVTVTIGQTTAVSAQLDRQSISVTSPAEDVIWGRGESRTITWSSSVYREREDRIVRRIELLFDDRLEHGE